VATLVVFDCNKIQSYVYASPRQREIRLASRQLEAVTEQLRADAGCYAGEAVGVAAGAGKVLFDDTEDTGSRCNDYMNHVVKEYREIGIECTVHCEENVDPNKHFGKSAARADLELRKKKDSPTVGSCSLAIGSPLFIPCESTGDQPAEGVWTTPELRRLSRVAGRHQERNLLRAVLDWEKAVAQELGLDPKMLWREKGKEEQGLCGDMEALVGAFAPSDRREQAKVALVVADVNDAGERFGRIESKGDYGQLSHNLPKWLAKALAHATKQAFQGMKALWPVFPIYIGGDDLMTYVPAERALNFAEALCAKFLAVQEEPSDQLTLGVGVAFGKEKTPFRQLSEMARGAERRAKQARRGLKQAGYADAHRACFVEYEVMRGVLPIPAAGGSVRYPTSAGPFLVRPNGAGTGVDELGSLLDMLRNLRQSGFPSNKIKTWGRLSALDKTEAGLVYAKSVKNLGNRDRQLLEQLLGSLTGSGPPAGLVAPERSRGGREECPLVDIATLWDLVD